MKREIKFRAWDKQEKQMIDANSWYFSEEFEPFVDSVKRAEDDFEIMQFTGLKDKNGNEIYEGDIVKSLLKSNSSSEVRIVLNEIKWNEYKMSDDTWGTIIYGFRAPPGQDLEVIGNIFDNTDIVSPDN